MNNAEILNSVLKATAFYKRFKIFSTQFRVCIALLLIEIYIDIVQAHVSNKAYNKLL